MRPQEVVPQKPVESESTSTVEQPELNLPESTARQDAPAPAKSAIELVWEIPGETVEGYVIRYGLSSRNLDKEIRVNNSDLTRITDSRFGEVYHYLITDAPNDRIVYVTIAALSGGTESEPSKVFEVKPNSETALKSAQPAL